MVNNEHTAATELNERTDKALISALDTLFTATADVRRILHARETALAGALSPANDDERAAYAAGQMYARQIQMRIAPFAGEATAFPQAWLVQGMVDTFAGSSRLSDGDAVAGVARFTSQYQTHQDTRTLHDVSGSVRYRLLASGDGELLAGLHVLDVRVWHGVGCEGRGILIRHVAIASMLPALAALLSQLSVGALVVVGLSSLAMLGVDAAAQCGRDSGVDMPWDDAGALTFEVVAGVSDGIPQ